MITVAMTDDQGRREERRINEAQARLMQLCWEGDGSDAISLALVFEGPDLVRLQMLALAEATVGERRDDVEMIRNGIAKLYAFQDAAEHTLSTYNIARSHFAIWLIKQRQLGFAQALFEARDELFAARALYEQAGSDPHERNQHRPAAWTDLGNSLSNNGRHIEALNAYDQALAHDPDFAMAHGNRGMGLYKRAMRMPDFHDPVICEAVAALDQALAHADNLAQHGDPNAIEVFQQYRSRIPGTPTHQHDTVALTEPHLQWCRVHDLLLHPSPRCVTPDTKILDGLRFGGMVVGIDVESQARAATLQDALNSLLQDYLAARYLAWQTLEPGSELRHAVTSINEHAAFTDTLTYGIWGVATGLGVTALATATNLLDKVACVTHLYLTTGRSQVTFFNFWLSKSRKSVDSAIAAELDARNPGLCALCDLACELETPGPTKTVRDHRHAATHRAIAVHEEFALAGRIPMDWVERITTAELRDATLDQLRRSKAAITYLMDLIVEHEKRVRPNGEVPSMPYWPAVAENPDLD